MVEDVLFTLFKKRTAEHTCFSIPCLNTRRNRNDGHKALYDTCRRHLDIERRKENMKLRLLQHKDADGVHGCSGASMDDEDR